MVGQQFRDCCQGCNKQYTKKDYSAQSSVCPILPCIPDVTRGTVLACRDLVVVTIVSDKKEGECQSFLTEIFMLLLSYGFCTFVFSL